MSLFTNALRDREGLYSLNERVGHTFLLPQHKFCAPPEQERHQLARLADALNLMLPNRSMSEWQ